MNQQPYLEQLEAIINDFTTMAGRSQHNDQSDLPKHERQALVTRSVAAVHRIAGRTSPYAAELDRIFRTLAPLHTHFTSVVGVVEALRSDLKAGYLQSLVDLVHADTFAEFADMAHHLMDAGYKDAAAVIIGSALEAHLRALCEKHGVAVEIQRPDGTTSSKKADSMNADLAGRGVYSKLDQKNVTAWLDLRNKAAHGKYGEYQKEQVTLMMSGVREFVART